MGRRGLLLRGIVVAVVLGCLVGVAVVASDHPPVPGGSVVSAKLGGPDDEGKVEQDQLVVQLQASSGSCGVERWPVKTGTDTDVGKINLQSTTPTTIASLDALAAPATLPQNNRVAPTETTVFQVSATLTRYKLENDSDYHLILVDGSGHSMITEIPDPACVASSSPLRTSIQKTRAAFDAQFAATTSFQNANIPVTVTGVGFFDFQHGQTGVAPNGIELHPMLDITFSGAPGTP